MELDWLEAAAWSAAPQTNLAKSKLLPLPRALPPYPFGPSAQENLPQHPESRPWQIEAGTAKEAKDNGDQGPAMRHAKGGRIRVGEATAFPNLFAFAQHHAVVVLTKTHYQPIDGYEEATIRNAVEASLIYLKSVRKKHPKNLYASINWNHLPTAAASMIHPHFQVIADEAPTLYTSETLKTSKTYLRKHGVNYWDDTAQTEKQLGKRYIADFGETKWYTSYSGLGNNDTVGVTDATNLLEMTPQTIRDLSRGLTATLRGYHSIGVQGFNMSLFSAPLNKHTSYYRVHLRIISRPDVKQLYTADTGFLERLHNEVVVETMPEEVAQKIRAANGL